MAAAPSATPLSSRVLLANINPGTLSTPFVQGLLESQAAGYRVMLSDAPPYLDHARNKVATNAMHQRDTLGWEWLLFVDSDIMFRPSDIETLLSCTSHPDFDPTATPLLCGTYYNVFDDPAPGDIDGQLRLGPVAYEWCKRTFPQDPPDAPPRWAFRRYSQATFSTLSPFKAPWNPRSPKGSLTSRVICAVGAVGTGFMAIHHSLLADLAAHHADPLPYFAEPVVNKVHLGEDMAFCHRVANLGYPVLVNRACVVHHGKTVWLP